MAVESDDRRSRRRIIAGAAVAILLVVAFAWAFGGQLGPATSGTPLALRTDPLHIGGSGCAGVALMPPLQVVVEGGALLVVALPGGEDQRLVWPFGFQARLIDGGGVLFDNHGAVVAREGDAPDIGGARWDDGTFHVCDANGRSVLG